MSVGLTRIGDFYNTYTVASDRNLDGNPIFDDTPIDDSTIQLSDFGYSGISGLTDYEGYRGHADTGITLDYLNDSGGVLLDSYESAYAPADESAASLAGRVRVEAAWSPDVTEDNNTTISLERDGDITVDPASLVGSTFVREPNEVLPSKAEAPFSIPKLATILKHLQAPDIQKVIVRKVGNHYEFTHDFQKALETVAQNIEHEVKSKAPEIWDAAKHTFASIEVFVLNAMKEKAGKEVLFDSFAEEVNPMSIGKILYNVHSLIEAEPGLVARNKLGLSDTGWKPAQHLASLASNSFYNIPGMDGVRVILAKLADAVLVRKENEAKLDESKLLA